MKKTGATSRKTTTKSKKSTIKEENEIDDDNENEDENNYGFVYPSLPPTYSSIMLSPRATVRNLLKNKQQKYNDSTITQKSTSQIEHENQNELEMKEEEDTNQQEEEVFEEDNTEQEFETNDNNLENNVYDDQNGNQELNGNNQEEEENNISKEENQLNLLPLNNLIEKEQTEQEGNEEENENENNNVQNTLNEEEEKTENQSDERKNSGGDNQPEDCKNTEEDSKIKGDEQIEKENEPIILTLTDKLIEDEEKNEKESEEKEFLNEEEDSKENTNNKKTENLNENIEKTDNEEEESKEKDTVNEEENINEDLAKINEEENANEEIIYYEPLNNSNEEEEINQQNQNDEEEINQQSQNEEESIYQEEEEIANENAKKMAQENVQTIQRTRKNYRSKRAPISGTESSSPYRSEPFSMGQYKETLELLYPETKGIYTSRSVRSKRFRSLSSRTLNQNDNSDLENRCTDNNLGNTDTNNNLENNDNNTNLENSNNDNNFQNNNNSNSENVNTNNDNDEGDLNSNSYFRDTMDTNRMRKTRAALVIPSKSKKKSLSRRSYNFYDSASMSSTPRRSQKLDEEPTNDYLERIPIAAQTSRNFFKGLTDKYTKIHSNNPYGTSDMDKARIRSIESSRKMREDYALKIQRQRFIENKEHREAVEISYQREPFHGDELTNPHYPSLRITPTYFRQFHHYGTKKFI